MNNSLIQNLVQDFKDAKEDLNLTSKQIADRWNTSVKSVLEWESGLIDPRFAGPLRSAITGLYYDHAIQQLDEWNEEHEQSQRKFLGLTGKLIERNGKLVVTPFPKKNG